MPPCSVVVLDLDGTLLRSDKTVSAASRGALQCLASRGVTLVIATARPRRAVWPLLPKALLKEWVVLYNGSQIWHRERLAREWTLAPASVRRLIAAAGNAHPAAAIGCEHADRLFVTRHFTRHWPAAMEQKVGAAALPVAGVLKIVIDLAAPQLEARLRTELPADCRMVVTDGGTLAQIMPAGTSKAEAVRAIAGRLQRRMEDVLCFGDDENDADLFAACGHPVAMANAAPAIRRLAAHATASNDEDGVARYLEAYFRL